MLSVNIFTENSFDSSSLIIQKEPELTKKDKQNLFGLLKELDKSEQSADNDFFNLFHKKITDIPIEKMIQDWEKSNTIFYILRKNEKMIGVCVVKLSHPVLKESIYIRFLCITKKERSSGYGRYFLDSVIRDLRMNYPDKHLLINVFDKNKPAKNLYSSLGFRAGTTLMINF